MLTMSALLVGFVVIAVGAAQATTGTRLSVDQAYALATGRATKSAGGYRIVLASDRDGVNRAYSMLPDGSRLAPLLPAARRLMPVDASANGRMIAYGGSVGPIYVSRANGTGLRRLVRSGHGAALSHDGRFLAFSPTRGSEIWVVGTGGRARKRVVRCLCSAPDWSPSGRSLVFNHWNGGSRYAIVVQPLRGKGRVLLRVTSNAQAGVWDPKWSPNGRWIAYRDTQDDSRRNGVWVMRPDGSRRHRVTPLPGPYAWSPDSRWLAVATGTSGVAVVGADVRGLRQLRLDLWVRALAWAPDGRRIALAGTAGDGADQIWVVGSNGSGLRRVTNAGSNNLVGWTRLQPVRPAAPPIQPSERVVDARTVATRAPIAGISADGSHVAFVSKATATDCEHVAAWKPSDDSTRRFVLPAPCGLFPFHIVDVELAGSRIAWTRYRNEGMVDCDVALISATLSDPLPRGLHSPGTGAWGVCKSAEPYHVDGDGDLLVFDDRGFTGPNPTLMRIGSGEEPCQPGFETARICSTLLTGASAGPIDSVSERLMAVRRPGAVTVLDERGGLVRRFAFSSADVGAARLDGDRLVVSRAGVLESYDVGTGTLEVSRPLPAGYRLVDVDGGIVVLLRAESALLLILADGTSRTFAPGGGPIVAELEPAGLYYAYRLGSGGRLVFVPRSELLQR
jgi:Tol biopolymer transport system component